MKLPFLHFILPLCSLLAQSAPLAAQTTPAFQPGRLLSTPAQREQLDELRRRTGKPLPPAPQFNDDIILTPSKPAAAPTPAPSTPAPAQGVTPLQFNGYIKRSRGPATYWVNQQALPGAPQHGELQITLPDGRRARLKSGEMIDAEAQVRSVMHSK
ncbi:hypothetical protein V8J88_09560 [Massilia sp. W12]|uniref:hypothetical protein n=1 Tax=Massilia sp. W12 TaxID=3126507 RepID=UPI0030CACD7A